VNVAPLTRAANLARRPDVLHGFSTRAGGVSTGSLASLNLAQRPGERHEALAENWRRVVAALGPELDPQRVAVLRQVHGGTVVRVEEGRGPFAPIAEADGAVTSTPGVVLGVRVADCVPVLLAAPGAVGVAHAGWRGTAERVAVTAARALAELAQVPLSSVAAAIGPCIAGRSFEVGDEVVEALCATGVPRTIVQLGTSERGRPLVDLATVIRTQLAHIGVHDVWVDGRCTFEESSLWSHRRDGDGAGRSAGVIALRPGPP
jgi:hypothetical protein